MSYIKHYENFINESNAYFDDDDFDLLDEFQFLYTYNRGQISVLTEGVIACDLCADGKDELLIEQNNAVVKPFNEWTGAFKQILDAELKKFELPKSIEELGNEYTTPDVFLLFRDDDIIIIFTNSNFKQFSPKKEPLKIWLKMSGLSRLTEQQRKSIFNTIGLDFTTFSWSDEDTAYDEQSALRMIKREIGFTEQQKEQIEMMRNNINKTYEIAVKLYPSFLKMFGKHQKVLGNYCKALEVPKGMEVKYDDCTVSGFTYDEDTTDLNVILHWEGKESAGDEVVRINNAPEIIKFSPEDYENNSIKISSKTIWEAMKVIVDDILA